MQPWARIMRQYFALIWSLTIVVTYSWITNKYIHAHVCRNSAYLCWIYPIIFMYSANWHHIQAFKVNAYMYKRSKYWMFMMMASFKKKFWRSQGTVNLHPALLSVATVWSWTSWKMAQYAQIITSNQANRLWWEFAWFFIHCGTKFTSNFDKFVYIFFNFREDYYFNPRIGRKYPLHTKYYISYIWWRTFLGALWMTFILKIKYTKL